MTGLYLLERPCPYCGEILELTIDCSGGSAAYVEDCQVCCAPILVQVWLDPTMPWPPLVELAREDD
ncbi:MAG: CPXCG motif-containing cysteine-rich protein [Chromatiaceae bacterium]|nr:MAG: CPXCG motif-containing cysteine-rich protein [Chromatiaceae bacterium]